MMQIIKDDPLIFFGFFIVIFVIFPVMAYFHNKKRKDSDDFLEKLANKLGGKVFIESKMLERKYVAFEKNGIPFKINPFAPYFIDGMYFGSRASSIYIEAILDKPKEVIFSGRYGYSSLFGSKEFKKDKLYFTNKSEFDKNVNMDEYISFIKSISFITNPNLLLDLSGNKLRLIVGKMERNFDELTRYIEFVEKIANNIKVAA